MKHENSLLDWKSKSIKPWMLVAILVINVVAFLCIGRIYFDYSKDYARKLEEENISNVNNLNVATANAAETYIRGICIKVNDLISYIQKYQMNYEEAIQFLDESNTNPDRQFQLIQCGTYGETGELSYGDYSGVSVRKVMDENGQLQTFKNKVAYDNGYYDILSAFTNSRDESDYGLCYVPEFTNADTKKKCFAIYRHVDLKDSQGHKNLYILLQIANSEMALSSYKMQSEYDGQSVVLVDHDGDYIIKTEDFRNNNFYDYIVNYNGLSLDWRQKLLDYTLDNSDAEAVNLFYNNHEGKPCVFSLTRTDTEWYSITCVPIDSFTRNSQSTNYSLMILLVFAALFVFDGVTIFFVGRVMNYNVKIAEHAREEAIRANQAKSRFLSSMSHELRTPLNAIIGFASLSEDSIDDKPVLKDYIKKIGISSKLLLQLISDILDVSAIESNKMKITNAEFDIAKLLSALSIIYYDQCAKKDIEFSAVLKDVCNEVLLGDSVRVNQLLLNYLSNAVKFTPAGGKVTLRALQMARTEDMVRLRFEVTDTGCGISEELKTRLFQPFERANDESTRRNGGSGLGLSIVKNLTELMGGTYGVDSKVDQGSCFWLEIPFGIPQQPTIRTFSPLRNLNVVVACGNNDEREYIGQILEGFGVEHSLTDTAGDVLTQIKEHISDKKPYDLCMMDWKMTDLSAPDAAKSIRSELKDKTPHIMILAYDISTAKLMCAQADSVFGKPIFRSTLYNALVELTDGSVGINAAGNENYDMSGKRALLVEDNKMNIEIAQLQLKKVGICVDVAMDGEQGYRRFIESKPGYYDIVLMDVQMPVMNGYESAKSIRESNHPQAAGIPILAMTADAFAEDLQKANDAGMNAHLSKPIDPKVLYATLQEYLDK